MLFPKFNKNKESEDAISPLIITKGFNSNDFFGKE